MAVSAVSITAATCRRRQQRFTILPSSLIFLLLLLFILPLLCPAHNWIHGRSRVGKASTTIPAPAKPRQHTPHVQVGPGQEFPIQWVTGHPNSYYYFVILHSDDNDQIIKHNEKMLREYIAEAPASAKAPYSDARFRKQHVSCSHVSGGNSGCLQYSKTKLVNSGMSGTRYKREIPPTDPLYFKRSDMPLVGADGKKGVKVYEYKDSAHTQDVQVAYQNPKYPWIEAVHRYKVTYKWVFEWDIARFLIPARKGSGTYMVHMLWRGYRDVVDVDVLPVAAKTIWGKRLNGVRYLRLDHCQFKDRLVNGTWRKFTTYHGKTKHGNTCYPITDGNVDACIRHASKQKKGYGDAVNVVPLRHPPGVAFPDQPVNIPWGTGGSGTGIHHGHVGSSNCQPRHFTADKFPDNTTYVCYPLKPAPDTTQVDQPWTISEDPADPVFYSTCFRKVTGWAFDGNAACPKCGSGGSTGATSTWRFGEKCVSCTDAASFLPTSHTPTGDDTSDAILYEGNETIGYQAVVPPDSPSGSWWADNGTFFSSAGGAAAGAATYSAPAWKLAPQCERCGAGEK